MAVNSRIRFHVIVGGTCALLKIGAERRPSWWFLLSLRQEDQLLNLFWSKINKEISKQKSGEWSRRRHF